MAVFGAMAIESAEEFVRLRTSEDPHDYRRAATEDAAESVWREVVAGNAEMRFWVAQNKSVPLSILRLLAVDDDPRVRSMVAAKRKLDDALCAVLVQDGDDSVRARLARNPNLPDVIVEQLRWDDSALVRAAVESRT